MWTLGRAPGLPPLGQGKESGSSTVDSGFGGSGVAGGRPRPRATLGMAEPGWQLFLSQWEDHKQAAANKQDFTVQGTGEGGWVS